MRIFLATAACVLGISSITWADQPQTPNTASKAAEAALAFLPARPAGELPEKFSEAPFEASWDVTEPAAAIRQLYRTGLDGLQSDKPAPYLALLASDYRQPGADRARTAQKLTEMLARNQCDAAKFCIISAQMENADRLVAQVWQEFTFTSKGTPPTYITTAPGLTRVVNNTGRLTVTQVLREEWVRTGAGWQIQRAETVAQKAAAVL